MAIEKNSTILTRALKQGYGVAAFNLFNYESVAWAIEAAELEKTPVIVMLYPACKRHIDFSVFAAMTRSIASKVSTPIGLHLDHSQSYVEILEGVAAGFTSVMIDASRLPYAENVSQTVKVVEACHAMDIDVEAELGKVGKASQAEDYQLSDQFTKDFEAKDFISKTGVDALAVAIGSAHGNYIEKPDLDFDRLREIRQITDIPLVLHGGSGIPDDQIKDAMKYGITKFNFGTEVNQFFFSLTNTYCSEYDMSKNGPGSQLGYLGNIHQQMVNYFRNKIQLLQP